jgi:hypothetical protein
VIAGCFAVEAQESRTEPTKSTAGSGGRNRAGMAMTILKEDGLRVCTGECSSRAAMREIVLSAYVFCVRAWRGE